MKKLFAILLITSQVTAFGQDTLLQNNSRPTIGLCLSGGGSKGFAHIGILEMVDSLNIPIDYVAGTSIGSIVGGLYAIGYTPHQIDSAVAAEDWDALMSDIPERKYEQYTFKDLHSRSLFTVGVGNWKVLIPSGLKYVSKVHQKLNDVTIGYHTPHNFLEFQRGFLCIAANLHTGEEVVMTNGILPDAMRASMSIPSMFAPSKFEGKTMVDGGTLNNFPVDHLKELGCDIVIGVDLATQDEDTTNLSLMDVLEKSAMFTNTKAIEENRKLCDILIKPPLQGLSGGDFTKNREIIERGRIAGSQHYEELRDLKEYLNGFDYEEKIIKKYQPVSEIYIDTTEIFGLNWVSKGFITGTLDLTKDEKTTTTALDESINQLYGSQYFTAVSYKLIPSTDTSYVLQLTVNEKVADFEIGVGIHYDPDYQTSFLLNISGYNTLIKGSKYNVDLVIAPQPRIRAIYEVDRGAKLGFGVSTQAYFTRMDYYENFARRGSYKNDDWLTRVYGLMTINKVAALKFGAEYDRTSLNFTDLPELNDILQNISDDPNASKLNYNTYNLFIEIGLDGLDDKNYPTKGHSFDAIARYQTFSQISAALEDVFNQQALLYLINYKGAFSFSPSVALIPELSGGFTTSLSGANTSSWNYYYNLGGLGKNYFINQMPMLGYHYNQNYDILNVAKGSLELRLMPFRNHFVSGLYNYAYLFKTVTRDEYSDPYLSGFGFKYSFRSFLGPIEVTAHKSTQHGNWLFYFNLGYWF